MKHVCCLLVFCALFCVGQPHALGDLDVVKVYPKNGEPMIVKNFSALEMGSSVRAVWNQQQIEISVENIKSIKFMEAQPDDTDDLEVEVSMKNGEKAIMRIKDSLCYGETGFGRLKTYFADLVLLDFDPDLSRPQMTGPETAEPQADGLLAANPDQAGQ